MVELPPLILCIWFFFQCYLIISLCTSLSGLHCPDTHRPSMGSCPLVFPVEQLCPDQISFGPLPPSKNPPQRQQWWYHHQCQKSFVSSRPVMDQVEWFHTVLLRKMHNVQANAQANPHVKGTGKGIILPCCKILVPQWGWFPHFSWALPEWSRHIIGSLETFICRVWTGWPSELGMPSGQLLASWLTGNASSACCTGVSLLLLSPYTAFSHSSCSRLWLMGNRKFQCRVWLCPSPSMGHTPHTGKSG